MFKGGTCLTKAYFGYYRFSEDLDFSFIDPTKFDETSQKKIRKKISEELEEIIEIINNFCNENDLDFKKDKRNKKYFEFRGGNKFTTIKIYYNSSIDNIDKFIKVQFNFLEKIMFSFKEKEAENLVRKGKRIEKGFTLPKDFEWVLKSPLLNVYSLDEILAEKIRAILTRQGVKSRDFIDVYKITSGDIKILEKIKKQIVDKIEFMLKYEKYKENLLSHKNSIPKYNPGEEKRLLIQELDLGFYPFLEKLESFLKDILEKLMEEIEK